MKDEKLLRDFVVHAYEMSDYWALAKINSLRECSYIDNFTPEEYAILQKLTEDETSRSALEKLLHDCGRGNVFSLLTYIDGATGVKPIEIVNAATGVPIAEDTLHAHLSAWAWAGKWDKMMSKVAKSKKRVANTFKTKKESI